MKIQKSSLLLALGLNVIATAGCGETEFTVLTYNIGGLPSEFSEINPEENIPKISPLLNNYDIVLIQENFVQEYGLYNEVKHPYKLPALSPNEGFTNPSGLSQLSFFEIAHNYQQRWFDCYGITDNSNDCIAAKGFSVAEYHVPLYAQSEESADAGENSSGRIVSIDIYNCHMDAGNSEGDYLARQSQIKQLASFIQTRSAQKAVILTCDTNMEAEFKNQFYDMLQKTGLEDSCQVLDCPYPDLIDHIMYRSGSMVGLSPSEWYIPEGFIDSKGKPLSDHLPVAVDFKITIKY